MSLINQMLADLEARRGGSLRNVDQALDGLASAPAGRRPPQRRSRALLALALVGGLGAAATFWYFRHRPTDPSVVVAASAPAATEAAGVVAAQPVILTDAQTPPAPPVPAPPAPTPAPTPSTPTPAELSTTASPPAPASVPEPASTPAPAAVAPETRAEVPAASDANSASLVEEPGSFHRAPAVPAAPADALAYDRALRGLAGGATEALQSFVAGHPRHAAARERLALAWLDGGQVAEAETLLRVGLQASPGEIRFARLLGHSLLSRGQPREALEALRPLAPAIAKDPEYHALLAAAEQGSGAHAQAVTRYRGLLQLQPTNGQWLVGLGISLSALGEAQAAAVVFNRALDDRALAEPLRAYAASEHVRLEGRKP